MRFVVDVHELADRCVRVFLRCRERLVPEKFLNGAKISAVGEEMRGKRMAHRVRVKVPINIDEADVFLDDASNGALRETSA